MFVKTLCVANRQRKKIYKVQTYTNKIRKERRKVGRVKRIAKSIIILKNDCFERINGKLIAKWKISQQQKKEIDSIRFYNAHLIVFVK